MAPGEVEAIKELLMTQITALEKRICDKFIAQDRALQLQAKEYERRLKDLNGEAERLRQMQATYMPREVFDKINEAHCKDIQDLKSYRDTQVGRSLGLSAGVSAAIAVAVALISKFVT